jgi:hypothetical protein
LQFTQSVCRNPTSRFCVLSFDAFGGFDGKFVKIQTAFSDLPKRPINCFLDKITFVVGFLFKYLQKFGDFFIVGFFIVNGKPRHQTNSRAFDKFFFTLRPFKNFFVSKIGAAKKMSASSVANRPIIKIFDPRIHLFFGYVFRVFNQIRDYSSLVNFGLPKLQS